MAPTRKPGHPRPNRKEEPGRASDQRHETVHGVPKSITEDEPKGYPHSERYETETSIVKIVRVP
jgi:hypothetical protein